MPRFGTITDHSQLNNLAYADAGHTGFSNIVNHNDLGNLAYADAGHTGFAKILTPLLLTAVEGGKDGASPWWNEGGYFHRVCLPYPINITTMGIWVDTEGSAGSLLDLGIYDSDGLLLSSGTVASSAWGLLTTVCVLALPAGSYWLAVAGNTVATQPRVEYILSRLQAGVGASMSGYADGVFPLPATLPTIFADAQIAIFGAW
uniref:Uncharacterized protein n=1 Tax=viral metagenome TaxID=1070528 RepID=A0A6M3LWB3_9ZZZZ